MNEIILIGRLTRDPELRYLPNTGTPVATFTLAVNRDYKDKEGNVQADFIPVEVMGKVADFVMNYITKGRLVAIKGSIRIDRYIKDDENRTFTKVSAKSVQALDSNKNKPQTEVPQEFQAIDDDEIPF
ncbi:single-stranded DNA-binding protein [Terrisporobacter othiniensis]|uniref:Single-stranded DNA-binding protein n=1 Tax=Terrisporobacter othiniensis TaxID=1577792 RepID=A0A0B3W1J4_9FIRM|nr:single-stranded DNA-binding protein [Terrisporobacter othiniensis]KHS56142.1 single-stranded DNA-binding protein [Terrisporobacter othiniensis]